MPNKTQSKAAVTAAATAMNNDIDNTLPVGVNIKDGQISFGPTHLFLVLDAGGLLTTANTILDAIKANLVTQNRTFKVKYEIGRREDDVPKLIRVFTDLSDYIIQNF